ncbi:hypothetical protein NHQ30_003734 [Ciborinia camelliae]|nr:hypothetical protein NHQ30_003734 [Ciborinia camelliae]
MTFYLKDEKTGKEDGTSQRLPIYRREGRALGVLLGNIIVFDPLWLFYAYKTQNVSEVWPPGENLLVLGRPGAGCSTLLSVLVNQRVPFVNVECNVQYGTIAADEMRRFYGSEIALNKKDDIHWLALPMLPMVLELPVSLLLAGWDSWIHRISLSPYFLEATMGFLMKDATIYCSADQLVPSGIEYENTGIANQGCQIIGGSSGSSTVSGSTYVSALPLQLSFIQCVAKFRARLSFLGYLYRFDNCVPKVDDEKSQRGWGKSCVQARGVIPDDICGGEELREKESDVENLKEFLLLSILRKCPRFQGF